MNKIFPEVSVCICTFKRPELLARLLESLAQQTFSPSRFEVVVVDNDWAGSAKNTVAQASLLFPALALRYAIEPTVGISYARNKTVELANASLLAFVDDDEWVVSTWISQLVFCMSHYAADAVRGPVIPQYPTGTPVWVVKSRFFERARFETAARISYKNCATSNAMVNSNWVRLRRPWPFDPRLALSGGEDTDFFKWLEDQGTKIIWCDSAEVNEMVPHSRQKVTFILKRSFRSSKIFWTAEYFGKPKVWVFGKVVMGVFGGAGLFILGFLLLPLGFGKTVRAWCRGMKGLGRAAALSHFVINGYGDEHE